MKYLFLPLLPLIVSACATIHSGELAENVSGDRIDGLLVSGAELSEASEESFSMISLTFENQGTQWVRIDKVEVLIDEETAKIISVVQGKDLLDWASAMEARARLEQQNREMVQLGLATVGAVTAAVGSANQDRSTTLAGLSVLGATEAWAIDDALTFRKDWAQNPNAVPAEHVYTPFAIPAKMFLRRWLLLNKPLNKEIRTLPLALHTVDGRRQVVTVNLR